MRFESLGNSIRGMVICPWNPSYEETREAWLGITDRWPSVLAMCMTVESVEMCCAFAKQHDLPVVFYGKNGNMPQPTVADGSVVIMLTAES